MLLLCVCVYISFLFSYYIYSNLVFLFAINIVAAVDADDVAVIEYATENSNKSDQSQLICSTWCVREVNLQLVEVDFDWPMAGCRRSIHCRVIHNWTICSPCYKHEQIVAKIYIILPLQKSKSVRQTNGDETSVRKEEGNKKMDSLDSWGQLLLKRFKSDWKE